MATSRPLRRLLRIRELEEEQRRLALELGLARLTRLESAMAAAVARDHQGRQWVSASVQTGKLVDRLAGIEEIRGAARSMHVLSGSIDAAIHEVEELRRRYLDKRVVRRQVETLLAKAAAIDVVNSGRRAQQTLDDWHRSRLMREKAEGRQRREGQSRSCGLECTASPDHDAVTEEPPL
jgi:flagellar biosynthesis chaperone FliJ